MPREDHPRNNICGRVRNPVENTSLKIDRQELQREWRKLTAKRNAKWLTGQEWSNEEDVKLRQIVAGLNLYNS